MELKLEVEGKKLGVGAIRVKELTDSVHKVRRGKLFTRRVPSPDFLEA